MGLRHSVDWVSFDPATTDGDVESVNHEYVFSFKKRKLILIIKEICLSQKKTYSANMRKSLTGQEGPLFKDLKV